MLPQLSRSRSRDPPLPRLSAADLQPPQEFTPDPTGLNPLVKGKKEPGRNDPCPCGSGKKYKDCCYWKDHR